MGKRLHEADEASSATSAAAVASPTAAAAADEALYPCKVKVSDTAVTFMGPSPSPPPSPSPSPSPPVTVMHCSLPPHHQEAAVSFTSIDAFEAHYAKEHSHRCASCGKNFPSARFLALHLDEHHNPLREAREASSQQGEKTYTYACFVDGCEKLCSSAQKRRLHLIDKHAFPRVYNFRVVETGIDKATSMLVQSGGGGRRRLSSASVTAAAGATAARHPRRRPSSQNKTGNTTTATAPSSSSSSSSKVPSNPSSDPVDELERSMSALRFVPPSLARHQGRKKAAAKDAEASKQAKAPAG